jgi:hypothetical protein
VTRAQHLVEILGSYCLHPEFLTDDSSDCIPVLLQLVTYLSPSQPASENQMEEGGDRREGGGEDVDRESRLPPLYLLQALSQCDARSLSLFGKVGLLG